MGIVPNGRGRPRKYGRPSRAVTVTLPEDVLVRLTVIDSDLGRAIVRLAEHRLPRTPVSSRAAELSSYGNHAVIVVTSVRALKRIPGVQLVPLGNGRNLISLERRYPIPQLELDLRDAIERDGIDEPEREALEQIAALLRRTRQSSSVSLEERTIVVLESKRRRRPAARPGA